MEYNGIFALCASLHKIISYSQRLHWMDFLKLSGHISYAYFLCTCHKIYGTGALCILHDCIKCKYVRCFWFFAWHVCKHMQFTTLWKNCSLWLVVCKLLYVNAMLEFREVCIYVNRQECTLCAVVWKVFALQPSSHQQEKPYCQSLVIGSLCSVGNPIFSWVLCGSYRENWLAQKKKWHKLIEILNKRCNSRGMLKIVILSIFTAVPAITTSKKMSVAANDMPLNNVVMAGKTFKLFSTSRVYFCWTYIFSPRADGWRVPGSCPLSPFIVGGEEQRLAGNYYIPHWWLISEILLN